MAAEILIAGLGNPGGKYERTRHNVGFMVVDALAEKNNISFKKQGKAEVGEYSFHASGGHVQACLLKPQTFMNLSGDAVVPIQKFYKIPVEKMLIIHDEIELPFGEVRLKKGGGHKGHNGLRDILAKGGSPDFVRLRVGVGRPVEPNRDVAGYVLAPFSKEEQENLPVVMDRALSEIGAWIQS